MDVTLTPIYDADPCPRVVVEVQSAPAGSYVTVTKLVGGDETTVRNARRREQTAFLVTDYEAPFGVPVEYRAVAYNAGGAVIATANASATIVDPSPLDYDRGWMQLPLKPASAVEVWWDEAALSSFEMYGDEEIRAPIGRGAPFSFGSPLSQTRSIPVAWHVIGAPGIAAVMSMLRTSRTLLVRTRDPIELPRAAYLSLSELVVLADDMDCNPERRMRTWGARAQVVRAPAAGIAVPVFTYSDVAAMYAGQTYDQVFATRPGATYLDWVRDPRP